MCINIASNCQSFLVLSFTIYIVFLPNHSTFTASFIHSHIDFVCVCVYLLPQGACSLIEFFSHRSVWQVALLASSVCSDQVLSWVRSGHIRLHKGTISLLYSTIFFTQNYLALSSKNKPRCIPLSSQLITYRRSPQRFAPSASCRGAQGLPLGLGTKHGWSLVTFRQMNETFG